MKWKNLTLETAVLLACYLVMTIPLTSATSVNIVFNGQIRESVEYEPSNIVNQHITYVRDTRDISWANVRVAIELNSANLAHTIKRVYLYKCGSLSPVGCMQKTPEVFDNYVNTEIAWSDIGQSTGPTKYPQEGNLLFLVKLEDPDGLTSWVGLWNTIKRNSHKEFLFYRHELSDVDVHASSSRLVGPIASYIRNFNTIPFRWLTKAAFGDALSISAIGGDDRELDTAPPSLQGVEPSTNDITVINKENYFIFPQTPGGTAFPLTLEQNPDFQCGDGQCESSLGEDQETCCYDCSCPDGYYCDAPPGSPETGECKNQGLIDLDIVGTPSAEVSDCSRSLEVGITARINNVPASMSDAVNGVVKAVDTPYAAQCTPSGPGLYDCRFSMSPTIQCGSGTRQVGPNELKLTVSYNDGINKVTRDLTEGFPAVSLNYGCSCPDGQYCDTGLESCQREDGITLGITELTSFLEDYDEGDRIELTAKIFNPPTGTVLVSTSAGLNLTNAIVSPGTPQCTGPSEDYEYECSIPFSITGYQESENYKFFPNHLSFEITYNDGPKAKTQILTTDFGPLSIPTQNCGNGVCNVDESYDNCCQDCGCDASGDYCDVVRGCVSLDGITLSAVAYPSDLEDCIIPHDVNVQATIGNAPYGVRLDYYTVNVNNQPVAWRFECPESNVGGVFDCMLEIPPIDACKLPHYELGPNSLAFTVSFPNGRDEQSPITRELSAPFDKIFIKPIPHIDGTCESGLGEDGLTACLDCPCSEDPAFGTGYYCDAGPSTPKGTCLPKSDLNLSVESPTSPVWFQSCEELSKVYVLMHVKNQPSGMRSENVFATVGGEAARYVTCRESTGTYLDSNITFNCTIGIPPVTTCTQDQTYNYTNNSISLVISYENGERGRVLQSLSAGLPDVYIHQSIRSIWEIMETAKNDMRLVLDRIMDLTEQMADKIHQCIKMQITVMFFNLVLMFALGFAGGKTDLKTGEKVNWKGFGEGIQAAGTIGTSLTTMVKSICDMYQRYLDIMIDLQELQLKRITMDTCLSIAQHDLDAGRCKGNEQQCFNQMMGCLSTLSDMGSIRDRIGGKVDSMGSDFINFNHQIQHIGEAISEGPWSEGEVSEKQLFAISIDGKGLDDNNRVCENKGFETQYGRPTCVKTGDNKGDAYVHIRLSKSDCSRERVILTVNKKTTLVLSVGDNGVDSKSKIENFLNKLDKVDDYNDIGLYCTNENPFLDYSISNDISKYKPIGRVLSIGKGIPDNANCQCTFKGALIRWIEATPSGDGGSSSYTSKCNFEPGKEFILFLESALGNFIDKGSGESFEPYNIYVNGGCRVEGTYDLRKDVIIETLQGYEPYILSGKEYWKVVVKTQDSLRHCASNDQGWLKVYDGKCLAGTRAGESFGKDRTELAGIEKSTETKVILITDNDIPVFQDTSSYDPNNEICSLPEGAVIKIHDHRCDGDNLWLNFQVEYTGDGSVSKPCAEGIMYWLPYGGVVGCSDRSLDGILENNEGAIFSSEESSETQNLGERISF